MTDRTEDHSSKRGLAIIEKAIELFNVKGIRFSMDELAEELGMSKKTIYIFFSTKEELCYAAADYIFDCIKDKEAAVLNDDSLPYLDKLKALLAAVPDKYQTLDFRKTHEVQKKYPRVFEHVRYRFESGWEPTVELIKEGVERGELVPFSVPVFKGIMEGSLEHFLSSDLLTKNGISYNDALEELVRVLVDGNRAS